MMFLSFRVIAGIAGISLLIGSIVWVCLMYWMPTPTWSSPYWSLTGAFIYTGGIQSVLPKDTVFIHAEHQIQSVGVKYNTAEDIRSWSASLLYYIEYPIFSGAWNPYIDTWIQDLVSAETETPSPQESSFWVSTWYPELHGFFSVLSGEETYAIVYQIFRFSPNHTPYTKTKVFLFDKRGNSLHLDDMWRLDDVHLRDEAVAKIEWAFSDRIWLKRIFGSGTSEWRYQIFLENTQIAFSGWEAWFFFEQKMDNTSQTHHIQLPYDDIRWYISTMPRLPNEQNALQIVSSMSHDWEKYVALTFDDGPNATTTPQLLDILAKYHVPATFYVLGSQVERFPEVAARIVADGHEIWNHSWDHPRFPSLSREDIWKQLESTSQAIVEATGVRPKTFRPPYGLYDDNTRQISREMTLMMWSVDSRDWKNRDVQKNLRMTLSGMHEGAIILFHDIHEPSVETIPLLIESLQKQGYRMVTVSELYKKYDVLELE